MSHLRFLPLVPLLLGLAAESGIAQEARTARDYHDRLVALIQQLTPLPLPPGDTAVTWSRGPILYHTVAQSDSTVSSGFLRNDSMVGLASVTWTSAHPSRFDVLWSHRDSTLVKLVGVLEGSQLVVRGTTQATFPLPQIPWAIADYGMDEHLVPLLRHLPLITSAQPIAVFRPFGLMWDTVMVRVADGPEGTLLVAQAERTDTVRWVIAGGGELLQLTRDSTAVERRPLEESRLYGLYRRVRVTPPDLR